MTINISNHPSSSEIKRVIEVPGYHKDFINTNYIVPYTLKHIDNNGNAILGFTDYNFVLNASNEKYVWVDASNNIFYVETPNCQQIGMYTFFENLLKNLTDVQIITAQILRLDSVGFFNIYL